METSSKPEIKITREEVFEIMAHKFTVQEITNELNAIIVNKLKSEQLKDNIQIGLLARSLVKSFITPIETELKIKFSPEGAAALGGMNKFQHILSDMTAELMEADKKHHDDKMSLEELETSWETILCELTELHREISRKKKRPDLMAKEANQVLAMSFKFMRDVIHSGE